MKVCPNCGRNISEFALSCPFCGNKSLEQEHGSVSIEQKTVEDISPKRHRGIGMAILIPFVMLFVSQLVFANCYSIYGADVQSSLIAAGWCVSVRSVLILLVSAVLFAATAKIKKLNTTGRLVIVTLICATVHFLLLNSIRINPDTTYSWEYSYIVSIIHIYAAIFGIGLSVLQGCLCIVAWNSKRKSPMFDIGLVTGGFCTFTVLGILLGGRILQQGIAGGLWAFCGTIAAIVIAVLITIRNAGLN